MTEPVRAPGSATARGDAVDEDRPPSDGAELLAGLRPVGPGGVLDGAFDLLRVRFRRIVGLAACLFIPIRLFDLATMVWSGDAAERYHVGPSVMMLGGDSGWSWVVVLLQSLALSILGICVGHLVRRMLEGGDASFRELGAVALRRSWVALAMFPITLLIRAPAACVGFVPGDALVFIASVVVGAEQLGPWRAVRRSLALTRHSYGPMLAVTLGGLVISQVLRVSFYTGPVLLAGTFSASDTVLTAVSQAGALVVLVAEPLTACIAARAYLELRCRNEGLDLRSRLHDRFAPPATVSA